MALAIDLVCPTCRRFWHGPPGIIPFPEGNGRRVCTNEGHALGRRPDPVVVVDRDSLPVTLEATDGELWIAERVATQKNALPDRHAKPRRDRWEQDRDATLAEQVVARHYGEPWTAAKRGEPDVGGKWEVRSIVDPRYGLVIRETDRLLPTFLVLVAARVCDILGWEDAIVVRERGVFRSGSNGESDYWTLSRGDLRRDDPPNRRVGT